MSRETLISVIVPVYNVEEYLEKCVDSIRRQLSLVRRVDLRSDILWLASQGAQW